MHVKVSNFQSIEDVRLNVDGFTLLVGESSQGKSATFRALQAAVSNRFRAGQVRNGTDRAEIGIKFSDDEPILKVMKPKDGSASMKLGDMVYSKLARTVPSEVSDLCNMEPLSSDRDSYSLNFHPQFEEPMLLAFSQQKVMELLSASEALDDLNLVKGALSDRRSEVKGAFTSLDTILSRLKEQHSELSERVKAVKGTVDRLRTVKAASEGVLQELAKVDSLIHESELLSDDRDCREYCYRVCDKLREDLSSELDTVVSLIDTAVELDAMRVRKTKGDAYVSALRDIVDKRSELEGVRSELGRLDSLQLMLDNLDSMTKRRVECDKVVNGGICPICGNKIGDCKDE